MDVDFTVSFVDPTVPQVHTASRYTLPQRGTAVLANGTWKVSNATFCDGLGRLGISCYG